MKKSILFGGGKRKNFILACSLMLAFILSGCSSDSQVLSTAISQIDTKFSNHKEQLHDYDSPYTICYQNKDDNYSMYIFASPIQFKTKDGYQIIDNTVMKSSKKEFAFENKANEIKTYFPHHLTDYFLIEKGTDSLQFKPHFDVSEFSKAKSKMIKNMYGDKVSAVMYESPSMDLVFYPTKAGIKAEIILRKKPADNVFEFDVKTTATWYENKRNGYILFKDGKENKSIIYAPLIKGNADTEDNLSIESQLLFSETETGYKLWIEVDKKMLSNDKTKYPVKFDPSFEMYLNKMPDTSVYSKFDTNSYLLHYAVIGEHPTLGEGWEYVRLRIGNIITTEKNILYAYYYVHSLYANKDNIQKVLSTVDSDWSSTQMVWSNKVMPGKNLEFFVNNL